MGNDPKKQAPSSKQVERLREKIEKQIEKQEKNVSEKTLSQALSSIYLTLSHDPDYKVPDGKIQREPKDPEVMKTSQKITSFLFQKALSPKKGS